MLLIMDNSFNSFECDLVCVCIFAMLCMKMFVNFHVLYTYIPLTSIIMGICAFFSSEVVKRFEFPKALYKFPIIIIIIIITTIIIAEMLLQSKLNPLPIHSP